MREFTTPLARVLDIQGRRQDWLAARVGVSRPYINKLARGRKKLSPSMARRISLELGVPPDSLLPSTGRDVTLEVSEATPAAD